MKPTARSQTLNNGAQLVTVNRPNALTSVVAVEFTVGSRFESLSEGGLSHFLEHMVFQGCASYPTPLAVSEAAESMGSTLDACTSRDTTRFDQRVTPAAITRSAQLICEMLTAPMFASLETEREIILEEALDEFTEDGRRVDPDTRTRLAQWPDHGLGRPIIGELDLIRQFGPTDLSSFLTSHYTGSRAVVTVLGPQDHEALAKAGSVFELLPGGAPVHLDPVPTLNRSIQVVVEHDHRSQCDCRLTFRTPGRGDALSPALSMLRAALDDGFASRMHRRLGTELGLAYDQWTLWETYPDAGLFELGAVVTEGKVLTFFQETVAILQGLAQSPPSGRELERIRFRARFAMESVAETTEGLIAIHATPKLFREPEYSLSERLERLMAVQPEDFARAARAVLGGHCVAYCVGPVPSDLESRLTDVLAKSIQP